MLCIYWTLDENKLSRLNIYIFGNKIYRNTIYSMWYNGFQLHWSAENLNKSFHIHKHPILKLGCPLFLLVCTSIWCLLIWANFYHYCISFSLHTPYRCSTYCIIIVSVLSLTTTHNQQTCNPSQIHSQLSTASSCRLQNTNIHCGSNTCSASIMKPPSTKAPPQLLHHQTTTAANQCSTTANTEFWPTELWFNLSLSLLFNHWPNTIFYTSALGGYCPSFFFLLGCCFKA